MYMVARRQLKYPADCIRMKKVLLENGFDVSLEECENIWDQHSSSMAAGWLSLPELDIELYEILESYIFKT